ncbi:MAG: hypothetical protein ACM3MK_11295 [Chitinophagales bacterium]
MKNGHLTMEMPIQIDLGEYLRRLPGTQIGPFEVKVLPGLPEGSWYLLSLPETAKSPEHNSISHRVDLMREYLAKLDRQYKGCAKPVDPEFYYLVRNMAKYLIEQAEPKE